MRTGNPRTLLFKVWILTLPLQLIAIYYLAADPFKVLWRYPTYYRSGYPSYISLNRDYVSTETFLRHQDAFKWDSFVFGNSRTMAFEARDWSQSIHSDRIFHFDAFGESIYGICRKLQLLEKRKVEIRNALIVLDAETLIAVGNSTAGHLYIKHPLLSGQSWISFELEFFRVFLTKKFILAYVDFRISHQIKPYMVTNFLLDYRPLDYDIEHNEFRFGAYEAMIKKSADSFYKPRESYFEPGPYRAVALPAVIGEPQAALLREMARILKEQHTNVQIVISPLYDQRQLDPGDLSFLKALFGSDRVHDFSGVNSITSDKFNYYDGSHFRPQVGRQIMAEIYGAGAQANRNQGERDVNPYR